MLDKVKEFLVGNYTLEKDDIDNENKKQHIEYMVESVIPNSKLLDELLHISSNIRKRNI